MTTLSPATTSFGSVTSTVVLLKLPSWLFSKSSIPPSFLPGLFVSIFAPIPISSVNTKVGLTSGVTLSDASLLFIVFGSALSVT